MFGLVDEIRFTNFPLNRTVFWSPHELEPSDNELLEYCEKHE